MKYLNFFELSKNQKIYKAKQMQMYALKFDEFLFERLSRFVLKFGKNSI